MPGGKRTDHISPRDIEVLEFIARFGVVPRSAVATWAGTRKTVTLTRERRLRLEDLVRTERRFGYIGPLVIATKLGLKASGRRELSPARLSAAALSHDTVAAELAARMERRGDRVLSEREILATERAAGEHLLSARLPGGRFHRSDLVRVDEEGSPLEAIEVELTNKGAARLDQLLRAWRHAVMEKRFRRVVYHCPPRTLRHVRSAVERTRTEAVIAIEELAPQLLADVEA